MVHLLWLIALIILLPIGAYFIGNFWETWFEYSKGFLDNLLGIGLGLIPVALYILIAILWFRTLPEDFVTPTNDYTYSIPQSKEQKSESSCTLLGEACIVDEWQPICLIKECIIDARSKE